MSIRSLILAVFAVAALCRQVGHAAQSLRDWRRLANKMVDEEVVAAGVTNERVLRAMRDTPRHEFVPPNQRRLAYYDMALPIGDEQTISPPFVVAYMTEEIDPQPTDRVLEIGTGSGYQAAVLSPLVKDVYTIEIVEPLGKRAARDAQAARLQERPRQSRRRLPRLARSRAVRQDHRHLLAGKSAAAARRSTPRRRPDDRSRRRALSAEPVSLPQARRRTRIRSAQGDALRAHDRRGRSAARSEARSAPIRKSPTAASKKRSKSTTQKNPEPSGWHYQRQLTLEDDAATAPDGRHFVTFKNKEPGLAAHALQGFAIDGRKISKLKLDFSVRGQNIRPGSKPNEWPMIVFTFYDDRRAVIDEARVGPFDGTFDWRSRSDTISVPLKARECIFRIGLLGRRRRTLARRPADHADPVTQCTSPTNWPLFATHRQYVVLVAPALAARLPYNRQIRSHLPANVADQPAKSTESVDFSHLT